MPNIIYEDNHLIVLNKECGDLVQGDYTKDKTLADKTKDYIKKKYNKPGKVFLGIPHRLDRPTSGIIVYTRTGKALKRVVKIFKDRNVTKKYWAVCKNSPENNKLNLVNYLYKNNDQNKSYVTDKNHAGAKRAELNVELLGSYKGHSLLEIELLTGRHHQIRVQLSHINLPIKGDLKYGYPTPNNDAGIHLHAVHLEFIHPVRKEKIVFNAAPPNDPFWNFFVSLKNKME